MDPLDSHSPSCIGTGHRCHFEYCGEPCAIELRGILHRSKQAAVSESVATDYTAKTHGNRNKYSVVYGVFKALLTYEGVRGYYVEERKEVVEPKEG